MKKNKKNNILLKGNGVVLEYTPTGYKCRPDWHDYEEEIFNLLGLYWDRWQTCEGVTIG